MPRILIGVPVHISKDYALDRWLKSVSELSYKAEELFLVDNSPSETKYYEKLKALVPQVVKNIKVSIIHIDIDEKYTDPEERVSFAREEIRKKVLNEGFDWWFSWECDTIAPPDVLDKLLKFGDDFKLIHHTSPLRQEPTMSFENTFGISLVHRDLLIKYGFLYQWGRVDPFMPKCYHGADSWFNRRVLRGGDAFTEITGLVKPVAHLDK